MSLALTMSGLLDFPTVRRASASIFSGKDIEHDLPDTSQVIVSNTADVSSDSNIEVLSSSKELMNADRREKNRQLESFLSKINAIAALGDNWNDEGIKGPNAQAIEFSTNILQQFIENELTPAMITQTVEEGVCFIFNDGKRHLYIEIYNDGERGAIVEDYEKRKVLSNKVITTTKELMAEVSRFYYYR